MPAIKNRPQKRRRENDIKRDVRRSHPEKSKNYLGDSTATKQKYEDRQGGDIGNLKKNLVSASDAIRNVMHEANSFVVSPVNKTNDSNEGKSGMKEEAEMQVNPVTQSYINNLRRSLTGYLKPNIGLQTNVYPYTNGSLIEVIFSNDIVNKDEYTPPVNTIDEALSKADLRLEDENGKPLKKVNFSGTNIMLVENKAFIVKDISKDEWTEAKASKDAKMIFSA